MSALQSTQQIYGMHRNHQPQALKRWNQAYEPTRQKVRAIWTVGYTYVPLNPIPIVDFIWYVLIKGPNVQSIRRTFELIHVKLIHLRPVFFILLICAISWGHSREGSTSSPWCLRIHQPPIDWGGYHFRRSASAPNITRNSQLNTKIAMI
jgi:hypothetical protein